MSQIQMKGYGLITAFEWMEKTLTPAQRSRMMELLPDEISQHVDDLVPGAWYPISHLDSWQRALVEATGSDYEQTWDHVVDVARYTARHNLSTVLRLLMKFLTPEKMVLALPKIWTRYFRNAPQPTTKVDPGGGRAVLSIEGFRGLRYAGPAIAGWVIEAFHMLDVTSVRVRETLADPDDEEAEDYRWEVTWDVG